ncbi:Nop7p [Sugiyamaella lignohabitans]|uniref:Pescadillo homolog n=1 Tax=Sugiyamaella lignohabitans TaxID=796027 RepID=A0A167C548_9ASCO|nr:Nop7p [Sugiyamaella lignohabitans]ANB11226.1 Nop7p [Sugiyamaella lignohabitans]
MRIKKKHQAGAAKNFITRTQAVKKLQVSLADFRRLCIFKGIYPREPRNKKKANKGSTKPTTFYYTKDIQYLLHEPVLNKFREHKIFARKLSRALGRGEVGDAKRLDDNRPRYKLDHIIKERYPTFNDALRDLDDPLCMLFLFAAMPATNSVNYKVIEDADRLCNQWMAYVARERLLRKVFVSIKGVYYQARVKGQDILWLVPFKFPQNIPDDIDFRIMLTFLEFYTTLLQFVLYRLYTESGLVYPPQINASKMKGVGGISAYLLESRQNGLSLLGAKASENTNGKATTNGATPNLKMDRIAQADEEADHDGDEQEEDENDAANESALDTFQPIPATETAASDILAQPAPESEREGQLFSNFTFFVGREVSLDIVEFLIIAFDGKVISESAIDELIDNENEESSNDATEAYKKIDLSTVTHQICDRPTVPNKVPGRTYIQPQWIFDSINKGQLLPVANYAPGEALPPHLSPWGDAANYDPEAALEDGEGESSSEAEEEETIEGEALPDEDEEEVDEEAEEALERQRDLEKEAAGIKFSEQQSSAESKKRKKKTAADKEQEEKDLRKIMMSNKQKKLYNKMQYGIDKKQAREEELKKKRRKIEATKEKLKSS